MDPARDPRLGSRPALSEARSFGPRLRRWLKPPRILRPTRAGWCFFVVIFAVGFAALNTGNNLLYLVLSLMLAFLALSGVLSESALRGIRVRRLIPDELFAEAENPIRLEITNRQSRIASFAVVVEDRCLHGTARAAGEPRGGNQEEAAGRVFALRVDPGGSEVRRYSFRPAHRGRVTFAGFRVSTRFPFGLFVKSMSIASREQALVYPAVESLPVPPDPAGARDAGSSQTPTPTDGPLVRGLREFQVGDLMRRVHWRASLRRSKLLVRELEDEVDPEVEVQLRTHGRDAAEAFEKRVTWAASELVAHLDAGLRVALRTDSDHIEAGSGARHRRQCLAFLALVGPDEPRPGGAAAG